MSPRTAPARRRWVLSLKLAGLAAGLLVVAQALPAEARAGSFDDHEVVQLTRAGQVRGDGGLAVHSTLRDDVRATNVAVATTTCNGCRATAVAFQVVLADRAPTSIDVSNLAYADNTGCTACESTALAYQFVVTYQDDVRLSGDGRHRLQDIDGALRHLARSGASPEDVQAAADGYAAQVMDIIGSEVHVRPVLHKKVNRAKGADHRQG